MVVETTAKLLVKLLSLVRDANNGANDDTSDLDSEVVLQAIHNVVLDVARSIGMSQAAGGSNGDLRLLRPLTGLLLPVLWDGDNTTAGAGGSGEALTRVSMARCVRLRYALRCWMAVLHYAVYNRVCICIHARTYLDARFAHPAAATGI